VRRSSILEAKISTQTFEAVVVGAGPAGLSAALILGRARRSVLVCDAGRQRNAVASEMHGVLSRDGMPPLELLAEATRQLLKYPTVQICAESVRQVRRTSSAFMIAFDDGEVAAKRIILATGMIEELPSMPGLNERWGKSVFSCPYCDAWELRDRALTVAGDAADLVPFAQELYQWSRKLTICGFDETVCSPDERAWVSRTGITTNASRIASLDGSPALTIRLENGEALSCDALFLCVPLVQHSHLVSDLNCATTAKGRVEVDVKQQTSVRGVYAAGDACAHIHQVVTAAASGAVAAIAVNDDLCAEDVRSVLSGLPSEQPGNETHHD
jgi:thioredoxin reductase